jgi:hypothetical protein
VQSAGAGRPVSENHRNALKHDPEKWIPVFGKDHARIIS